MITALIWLALFAATAATDFLAARWVDARSAWTRAGISAVHEAVGFVTGFTVFTWTQDIWMVVPCACGAWLGSYFAGKAQPTEALDPAFLEAVHQALEVVQAQAEKEAK